MASRKEILSRIGRVILAVTLGALLASVPRSAKADFGIADFESGIPSGWTFAVGGVGATNEIATNIAPTQGDAFGYITTAGSTTSMSAYGGITGTVLTSHAFTLATGDVLHIDLNFLTNDNYWEGSNHDLAVVELLDASSSNVVATLYSAEATTISGVGVPCPTCGYAISTGVTLTPSAASFDGEATGPVGGVTYGDEDEFSAGSTGWVSSSYAPGAGTYQLRFVVANTIDGGYDSALAIDNIWSEGPTAVKLANFEAVPAGDGILITWETAIELDNLGFNLYRSSSVEGSYVKLNDTLIPAQNPGQVLGATYTWLDGDVSTGSTYSYLLEDIDITGVATTHGPVNVAMQSPSALSLTSVTVQGGALLGTVLTLVAVVSVFILHHRRE